MCPSDRGDASWWIVSGRVEWDDEDTPMVFAADTMEEAAGCFEAAIAEDNPEKFTRGIHDTDENDELIPLSDEDQPAIIIVMIARCGLAVPDRRDASGYSDHTRPEIVLHE